MIRKWFWSLLLGLILTASLQAQSRESLLRAIEETPNWSSAEKPAVFDEKTIATLDKKRASAILRYGFTGATVQDWRGPGGIVRMTLYEMLDTTAAYGLFT